MVPFAEIPGFPRAERNVVGHRGRLVVGDLGGKRVVAFQGRIHRYQGFSAREVSFPVRLASAMGAETLIVTNAAGGIAPELARRRHRAHQRPRQPDGRQPARRLAGARRRQPVRPDARRLRPRAARASRWSAAAEPGVPLVPEGVYAGLLGPSYETPAEVAMLRALGADVVGMSTVPEVIAARALGMRVLGLSLVTNVAAGVGLAHAEVLETGRLAARAHARARTCYTCCGCRNATAGPSRPVWP